MSERPLGYFASRFVLELDQKKPVGVLLGIEGANFKSDTIQHVQGRNLDGTRYQGRPKYEEFTITCGMSMSAEFWIWVKDSLENKPSRKSGAIVIYDHSWVERGRRTFTEALISEVQFPSLDSGQNTQALFKVKIAPETLTFTQTNKRQSVQMQQSLNELTKSKPWQLAHFDFRLDKFGDSKLPASMVGGFTVKQNIIDAPVGYSLAPIKEVGRLEMPTIQVTFNEIEAMPLMDWFNTAVVAGNWLDQETTGHLTYLDTDMKSTLMRLDLDPLGLVSVDFQGYESGKKSLARVVANFYCDSIKFKPGVGIC